ncbi:serine/threonine protein phosphatase [Desulfobacter hydrogenophilus]|uniref:HAMP domain-containing protein n=1 Tax=Desulfobacter hydrogenophilus TaxID=2291 RepID=A0A328FG15_9BACT|nr:SpoIIE family protein phosphatase [Desulfobacter hydrogenophilus]NDY70807.1 SpoIIE family protein phosphatase [Desulfobacter hydrogenophilus]QBH11579.1 HAMP domain-containing protein [Desulfobacter hydrogenophilus]RAM03126.1 serine/threonine protein phosphatase [Desulfobacter hydrogenophilus]
MFSTIKGKILFAVIPVMVISTLVNIFFTHRDVGNAMLKTQQNSALNILRSLDLIIEGDYHNLLKEKRSLTILKRSQLKDTARLIASVFESFVAKDKSPETSGLEHALSWLETAPFDNVNYYIIDAQSNVTASSNAQVTTLKSLNDVKHRNIAKVMQFDNLTQRGDFAAFNPEQNDENASVLAYFKPFTPWSLTIGVSVDISRLQALAEKQKAQIISSLTDYTQGLKIADSGFVYIFDTSGTSLVPDLGSRSQAMSTLINQLTGNLINDDIRQNASAEFSHFRYLPDMPDKNAREMIAYCYYFKPFKWYISVIIPLQEIKLPAQRLVIQQSLIIVMMFMAGIVAIILVISRIATPLQRLSSYARKIPKLDFTKPMGKSTPVDDLPKKYKDEVGDLAASFILMRHELSRNIQDLINSTAARQRFESELEIAREIQLGMVPKTFPKLLEFDHLDLYATLQPAKEVGGDLYDFFQLDDDHVVFTLGDVSDKGVPAALFMVVTRTLIRVFSGKDVSPARIMTSINNVLSSDNPRSMFVTLIIGILNIRTGQVIYANGGHNPPIIITQDGARFIENKKEPIVGAMPGIIYSDSALPLSNGQGLMLYTDGVNEAMNKDGEQFSNQRMIDEVSKDRDLPSETIVHNLLDRIRKHAGSAPQSDDIAMLMIRFQK